MKEQWELTSGLRRLALRNKPGRKPVWNFTKENGKLVREGKGGIDWWRYQQTILVPKLLPFAVECMKKRTNTVVQEDKAPAHAHHAQQKVYDAWKVQRLLCQLRSVDLSLPAWNIIPDTTIFRNTLWTHLKDLALQGFCVSQLAPAATWDLQRLDLSLCSGAETLIKRLLAMDKLSSLRSLHFAGHLSRQTFLSLLSQLSKMYQLEELSLRLGGLSHLAGKTDSGVFVHGTGVMADPNDDDEPIRDLRSLVLDKITSRSKTLKSLVLDIREVIDQPQSSMRFDLHGVQRLIGSCPIIEFIGMPVNLRASGGHRYRRMNYAYSSDRTELERQIKEKHIMASPG
ncbi:Ribonuclease H superfamily [Fusarium oxysporum f. sp. vasinfectum]|nr:Ribonuclease H superfamily [Fusarium oxysporum f. sp. vasinfectum]